MELLRRAGVVTIVIGAFAVGFHFDAFWRQKPLLAVWLFGWSIAPYLASVGLNVLTGHRAIGILPALVAVALDVRTFLIVQSSTSSTAVLDKFWTPVLNVVLVVPLGALVGWLVLKLLHAHRAAP